MNATKLIQRLRALADKYGNIPIREVIKDLHSVKKLKIKE